jgi:prepilin-type N-terminal cleavage/methylation domain-containing protein
VTGATRLLGLLRARVARGREPDGGFTLVELLVASMISVIVLGLVGSLFLKTMQTQRSVEDAAGTTNNAKVVFDDLQSSVRLSGEVDVRAAADMTTTPADGKGDVLVLKSRVNEGVVTSRTTWRCVAWYIAPDRTLHKKVVSPPPASGTAPMLGAAPASWPVVARDVSAVAGQSPFTALDPNPDVAAWYPGSVTVALKFQSQSSRIPVSLQSTITPRRQLQLNGEIPGGVHCV